MYSKVLVALDGSDSSRKALLAAVYLARALGSTLHALGVVEHLPHFTATVGEVEQDREQQDTFMGQVLEEARRLAAEQGVHLTTETRSGHAAHQIVQVARDGGFDLIVLGADAPDLLRDILLGATTDIVTHNAPCSVLAVR